jgi:hypothetical protein
MDVDRVYFKPRVFWLLIAVVALIARDCAHCRRSSLSQLLVANLATNEHANDLAAFGAALRFTGDFELGTWTVNHDLSYPAVLSIRSNPIL